MIAKVIAHGPTRDVALDRLSAALATSVVAGPRNNVAFLRALADSTEFRSGVFDTGFIDRNLDALAGHAGEAEDAVLAAGVLRLVDKAGRGTTSGQDGPWSAGDGFQLLGTRRVGVPVEVDGEPREVGVVWDAGGPRFEGGDTVPDAEVVEAGDAMLVIAGGRQASVRLRDPFVVDLEHLDAGGVVKAPMHGKLVVVFVKPGDTVEKGQRLAVVEAMKMEHALVAPRDGVVAEVAAEPGAQVAEGDRLISLAGED
jgi:3-methylcrotonyl-CoA carboxylase alpha subunit